MTAPTAIAALERQLPGFPLPDCPGWCEQTHGTGTPEADGTWTVVHDAYSWRLGAGTVEVVVIATTHADGTTRLLPALMIENVAAESPTEVDLIAAAVSDARAIYRTVANAVQPD